MIVDGFCYKLHEKKATKTVYRCENKYRKKCLSTYAIKSNGIERMSSHSNACRLSTKKKWQKIKHEQELLEKVIKREDYSDEETDLDKTIEYIKEEY
jgi:uncharacterized protein with NRDE domain